jgi:hypothetical protein
MAEQHLDCAVEDMDDAKVLECFGKIEGKYIRKPISQEYYPISRLATLCCNGQMNLTQYP